MTRLESIDDYLRAAEGLIGAPVWYGNTLEVLRNGEQIFPAMLDAIRDAENTIDFLTYVWWKGEPTEWFTDAFCEKAEEGLRVRVLLDAVGSRLMDSDQLDRMRDGGVLVEQFRDIDDPKMWRKTHRTHRRVLVTDGGKVAFTGGVGIAEEWMGDARNPDEWRDTQIRITGPAVNGLRAAFVENWAETDHALVDHRDRFPPIEEHGETPLMVVASSAGHGVSRMSLLKRMLIELAQERINITSAYLAPEEHARRALADACNRGVEVRLLIPGEHVDKRVAQLAAEDKFEELLDIGVRIFTYERTMLHAKTLTIDGVVADIGSANFNARSFSQDEEIDVVAFDEDVAEELDGHFDADLEYATEVTAEVWEERGWVQKAAENAVGLVDDVM